MANSIITKTAKEKMAKARAGLMTLPKITGMAFGSGGVDDNGDAVTPNLSATTLINELLRKTVDSITPITDDTDYITYRYSCTLGAGDIPGEKISEIGLYDSEGDIVAIRTFAEKAKDEDIDMQFDIDDKF